MYIFYLFIEIIVYVATFQLHCAGTTTLSPA